MTNTNNINFIKILNKELKELEELREETLLSNIENNIDAKIFNSDLQNIDFDNFSIKIINKF